MGVKTQVTHEDKGVEFNPTAAGQARPWGIALHHLRHLFGRITVTLQNL